MSFPRYHRVLLNVPGIIEYSEETLNLFEERWQSFEECKHSMWGHA